MKVAIKELNEIYELINEQLFLNKNFINITDDYYWNVPTEDRKNVYEAPELNIGSLEDDWSELKKSISRKFITPLDLERFANILISLSEEISL